jgi:hypothetical protein
VQIIHVIFYRAAYSPKREHANLIQVERGGGGGMTWLADHKQKINWLVIDS